MVVLNNYFVDLLGETQSKHPANGVIMIADSPIPTDNDVANNKIEKNNNMTAQAVLICRPNSHPFQERKLSLDQSIKIGRSVAKARPGTNNAIFDCKVLSRNHAVLWYETGKFYLQDTKSSNGTFVNNQRLNKGSEESPAREVCSGDIVQFGVDVMENSRKVTHGCVIATLKLYLPDGKEAKASPTTSVVSGSVVGTQELYQLAQYLQEAMHREQQLENKLATLQRIVSNTKHSSDTSWKALIDEDRLLTRLELLENQVQAYSKNFTEDKVREEMCKLQEDKDAYQKSAKESLRKVLQEKLEAVRKLQELEASLSNAEDECSHLQKSCDGLQNELDLLAAKNSELIKEITDISAKFDESEVNHKETLQLKEEEQGKLENQLDEMKQNEERMCAKLERLQADDDFTKEQLALIRARISNFKKDDLQDLKALTNDTQVIMDDNEYSDSDEDSVEVDLHSSSIELEQSRNEVTQLQELLENHLKKSKQSMNNVASLEAQVEQWKCESDTNIQLIDQLQDQIVQLEDQLNIVDSQNANNDDEVTNNQQTALQAEICKLQELLAEARNNKKQADDELSKFKDELDAAEANAEQANAQTNALRQQLNASEQQADEIRNNLFKTLKLKSKSDESSKKLKRKMIALKTRLGIEEESGKAKQKHIDKLLCKLEENNVAMQKHAASIKQLNSQLQDAQQSAKRNHNEAELLRGKVKALQENTNNDNDNDNHLKSKVEQLQKDASDANVQHTELLDEHNKLKESYSKLKIMKERMECLGSGYWKAQAHKITEDYELCQQQLESAQDEVLHLKREYSILQDAQHNDSLQLSEVQANMTSLSTQNQLASSLAVIPLIILIVAIVIAYLPFLSSLTGTQDKPNT